MHYHIHRLQQRNHVEYPVRRFLYISLANMMSYFDNSLAWLTNDMVTALEHQHKLFLPAAGVFLMQDAKFNKRGDLLATLHYNG